MPQKPLLIFPAPSVVGRYKIPGGEPKKFKIPSKEQQLHRIQPTLNSLNTAFQNQRVILQSDVSGHEPEMVLVLETRGLVQDFFKAVRAIPELEWLGEWEKDFDPDDFFHYTDSERQIKGKFFFILTNYQALKRILSLWRNYRFGNDFERGTTKWRNLFELLYDIRPWGVVDRIEETGIMQDWNDRVQNQQEIIPFEIELWFRKSNVARLAAKDRIVGLIEQFDGELISESIIPEIAYHALLIKAPIQIFNNLNEQTDIEFFKSQDVMFFRPVGQCAFKIPDGLETLPEGPRNVDGELTDPLVALLDGYPLQNHSLLANRLLIDDPDNYGQNYLATTRIHGTSMASIIIHGDLQQNNPPIKSKLYVRPVTRPVTTFRGQVELIPEDILIIDLIHRSVRRMFEGDGESPAAAPTVRIINISLGDPFRVLDHMMSSWAKILDWLSFKYNVLFVVSAGNFSEDLDFAEYNGTMQALLSDGNVLKSETLKAIYNNNRHRKIISPAESINALTVGASDFDNLNFQPPNARHLLFQSASILSPLSRMGLGYRRSIKPEIIVPGGRALFREKIGQSKLTWIDSYSEPGIKVAAPSSNGNVNGVVFSNGTSNSAANLSHLAAKLHENLLIDEFPERITNELFPLVAKNLLVHCASWNQEAAQQIVNAINLANGNTKDLVARFLGYGNLNPERVFECTEKRATLIGTGELSAEQAHLFKLPIPVALSGSTQWRSITVTLAWFSPVNCLNQTYRQAKLWFDFPNKMLDNLLSVSRKYYDNDTVNRGTIQHEIFEGTRASAILEGAELGIRVNCKEDAPGLPNVPIKYVLAVTLEIAPVVQVDIYEHISLRIRPRVPAANRL